jgi:hypothetical protein
MQFYHRDTEDTKESDLPEELNQRLGTFLIGRAFAREQLLRRFVPAPTRHRKSEHKNFTAKTQSTHTRTTSGTIPIFSVSSVSLW